MKENGIYEFSLRIERNSIWLIDSPFRCIILFKEYTSALVWLSSSVTRVDFALNRTNSDIFDSNYILLMDVLKHSGTMQA